MQDPLLLANATSNFGNPSTLPGVPAAFSKGGAAQVMHQHPPCDMGTAAGIQAVALWMWLEQTNAGCRNADDGRAALLG